MFVNSFGVNTFQVSQIPELQDNFIVDSVEVRENEEGRFFLNFGLVSRRDSKKLTVTLVTQRNLVRYFKTVDSALKVIRPLTIETKADEPFHTCAALSIHIRLNMVV
jgi:hypothetical protein